MTNTMTGLPVIDGYQLLANDRVLVRANTDEITNGIYCADTETEILTKRGFLKYSEVLADDSALTLNMETGRSEWEPILSLHTFPVVDHEMLLMEIKGHSSLTTLDHRWPVLRRRRPVEAAAARLRDAAGQFVDALPYDDSGPWRVIRRSAELDQEDFLIRNAPCTSLPTMSVVSDAMVEIVAWFITEGNIRKNNSGSMSNAVRIVQSFTANPDKCDRIAAALTGLFGPPVSMLKRPQVGVRKPEWRATIRETGMQVFDLNTAAGRQLIEIAPKKVVKASFISSLTKSQLELFVDACIAADGTITKKGRRVFIQNCFLRTAPLQMACTLLGIATSTCPARAGCHNLNLMDTRRTRPQLAGKRVRYTGKVWCPRTGNGTWLARRKGTVYFTGNTAQLGAWTRAIDFAFNSGVVTGTQVLINNGATFANVVLRVTTLDPIVVGSSLITFSTYIPGPAAAPIRSPYREVTSGHLDTATSADGTIGWNVLFAGTKIQTIPAPAAVTAGQQLTINDTYGDCTVNPIRIAPASGTVNKTATLTMGAFPGSAPGMSLTLQSNGVDNWAII